MCGIVGYIGKQEAKDILLDGLTRLEYRGYDSAGIALASSGQTHLRRAEGKLKNLQALVAKNALPSAHLGIGHTRWATHGRPSENNAHPHHYQSITVVHNGIIENYLTLRADLKKKGHEFSSETDSEILAHLVAEACAISPLNLPLLRQALKPIQGSYAIALMDHRDPAKLFIARRGSPLVMGFGNGEQFAASDVPALLPYTREVQFLEDGQIGYMDSRGVTLEDLNGKAVTVKPRTITWNLAMAEKGGYKHFMLKEIFEQGRALTDTLRGHLEISHTGICLPELEKLFLQKGDLKKINKIYLVACGTSWHAALSARYFLESMSGIAVDVEQASEFRYRDPVVDEKSLVVAVSQSGETADTLEAVRLAKQKGAKVLTICNVVDSTLARESHAVLYTHAGPEIAVAATKTFVCQLAALQLLALWLGQEMGRVERGEIQRLLGELLSVPQKVDEVLKTADTIQQIALKYAHADHCLFMGRGPEFPIALEGALKLKEISYLHAEGYSAGELKHGPIALIDHGTPVVSLIMKNRYYDKMISNIQEVLSRQAQVIAIAESGDARIKELVPEIFWIPPADPFVTPILAAVPLQLFAYYIADHKGHDVDQPRNLAKSVTVE
jgi:glucosamine--fructose-6-phosphate aminotransferase (isomerizing)